RSDEFHESPSSKMASAADARPVSQPVTYLLARQRSPYSHRPDLDRHAAARLAMTDPRLCQRSEAPIRRERTGAVCGPKGAAHGCVAQCIVARSSRDPSLLV